VVRKADSRKIAQHISGKKTQEVQRSHSRKHSVPTKLGELIDLVNQLLKSHSPPPTLQLIASYAEQKAKDKALADGLSALDEDKEADRLYGEMIQQEIERLPPKLREFVGTFALRADTIEGAQQQRTALERYDYLTQAKILLSSIAGGRIPNRPLSQIGIRLYRNEQGKADFQYSPLAECIQGAELDRIRRCPICEKIYWADRIDQPTCSQRCNGVRRSRIQRGTYKFSLREHPITQKAKSTRKGR
jgi:endogenous inhibitor of DNA gyrase (YacG/DUF329 family)